MVSVKAAINRSQPWPNVEDARTVGLRKEVTEVVGFMWHSVRIKVAWAWRMKSVWIKVWSQVTSEVGGDAAWQVMQGNVRMALDVFDAVGVAERARWRLRVNLTAAAKRSMR